MSMATGLAWARLLRTSTLIPKKLDVEYTSFLEEHRHALAKAKQGVAFWEANRAKKKANKSANRERFKSSFADVLQIRKELIDASMSKYMKKTDSIQLNGAIKM